VVVVGRESGPLVGEPRSQVDLEGSARVET